MFSVFALAGCKEKEPEVTVNKEEEKPIEIPHTQENVFTEEKEEESKPVGNENLLTGEYNLPDHAVGKRPVAVMVSNVEAAMPQYGITPADVFFEMPVEGELTRFMALYSDYSAVPTICSVRSCRDYFPSLSEGFDAFYIHWGMDESIRPHYEAMKLDKFDGTYNDGKLFGRDSERKASGYATEHTGLFKGPELAEAIERAGMRTELLEGKQKPAFQFAEYNTTVTPNGEDCTELVIDFGNTIAEFQYDTEEKVYKKQFNGKDQKDGKTKEQLAFTNVIVLETVITPRPESPGRVDINWRGGENAKGYYVSNGKKQEIRWSKANEDADLLFYDVDGSELVMNRGKSYIAFNYPNQAKY